MTHYALRSTRDNTILFEGRFLSFLSCLENAVRLKTPLPHIDLRHKNLSNATLDDAIMPYADFSGTNLTGTNLSESDLNGSNFNGAALYNACLTQSDLTGCNFENASFGGTDIYNALLNHTRFSTLSCFSLDFRHAQSMRGCLFINPDGRKSFMSNPPIVIKGLTRNPLVILDEEIRAGHNILDQTKLRALAPKLYLRTLQRRLSSAL